MLATVKRLFSFSPLRQQAGDAYVKIVEQARLPVFYEQWKVEDTIDGRFDVIILHLFLVLSRLEHGGDAEFCRCLQEVFFADMDRSLREMGASDTGVGIRVKNMAQAFYGRMKAYRDCIGDDGLSEGALAQALKRNVYRDRKVEQGVLASLAAYMGRNDCALRQKPAEALQQQGVLVFSS